MLIFFVLPRAGMHLFIIGAQSKLSASLNLKNKIYQTEDFLPQQAPSNRPQVSASFLQGGGVIPIFGTHTFSKGAHNRPSEKLVIILHRNPN